MPSSLPGAEELGRGAMKWMRCRRPETCLESKHLWTPCSFAPLVLQPTISSSTSFSHPTLPQTGSWDPYPGYLILWLTVGLKSCSAGNSCCLLLPSRSLRRQLGKSHGYSLLLSLLHTWASQGLEEHQLPAHSPCWICQAGTGSELDSP